MAIRKLATLNLDIDMSFVRKYNSSSINYEQASNAGGPIYVLDDIRSQLNLSRRQFGGFLSLLEIYLDSARIPLLPDISEMLIDERNIEVPLAKHLEYLLNLDEPILSEPKIPNQKRPYNRKSAQSNP